FLLSSSMYGFYGDYTTLEQFFFSSRRRHTRWPRDWSSDVCSSDLPSTKLYQKIAQEEEVHEKTRQTLEKKRDHIQEFVDRFGAKANKASQAQSKLKALNRLPSLDEIGRASCRERLKR